MINATNTHSPLSPPRTNNDASCSIGRNFGKFSADKLVWKQALNPLNPGSLSVLYNIPISKKIYQQNICIYKIIYTLNWIFRCDIIHKFPHPPSLIITQPATILILHRRLLKENLTFNSQILCSKSLKWIIQTKVRLRNFDVWHFQVLSRHPRYRFEYT